MFRPKNILVTGAAGFIGANFVHKLFEQYNDIQVISLDKLTYAANLDNLKKVMGDHRHQFIQGDINNAPLVNKLLVESNIDTIVHFAAESHVDNSINNPKVFFETNIMGTLNLVEQAKIVWLDKKNWDKTQCRFHHISTDEVYGSLTRDEPSFTETTQYQPNSPYSASKAGSDHIVRAYVHTYNLPATVSHCSNNFGPYQHQEKLIPVVINACIKQENIPIYGDGSNIRDWLYVEDHCEAILKILESSPVNEVYNIGGNNELSNLILVRKICTLMDQLRPVSYSHLDLINFVTDRKGHDWRYSINCEKISMNLGWSPPDQFASQLEKTVKFYMETSDYL